MRHFEQRSYVSTWRLPVDILDFTILGDEDFLCSDHGLVPAATKLGWANVDGNEPRMCPRCIVELALGRREYLEIRAAGDELDAPVRNPRGDVGKP
jgi:hypothetical protein